MKGDRTRDQACSPGPESGGWWWAVEVWHWTSPHWMGAEAEGGGVRLSPASTDHVQLPSCPQPEQKPAPLALFTLVLLSFVWVARGTQDLRWTPCSDAPPCTTPSSCQGPGVALQLRPLEGWREIPLRWLAATLLTLASLVPQGLYMGTGESGQQRSSSLTSPSMGEQEKDLSWPSRMAQAMERPRTQQVRTGKTNLMGGEQHGQKGWNR